MAGSMPNCQYSNWPKILLCTYLPKMHSNQIKSHTGTFNQNNLIVIKSQFETEAFECYKYESYRALLGLVN